MNEARRQDHLILETLPQGYARHRIVTDAAENAVDYVFLEANPAFESMTGLSRADIIGRRATEVLPGLAADSFDWIQAYGQVARGDVCLFFEQYSSPLRRWYEVRAYSHRFGFFDTVFSNITARKKTEQALHNESSKMKLLVDVSKAMVAARRLDQLSQVIVDGIAALTDLRSAAIYLLQGEHLRLEAAHPPLPPDFPEHLRIAPRIDHPHISRALASKAPVVLADSHTAELTPAEQHVCKLRSLRSILYVPLLYKQEPIGVLIPCSIDELHEYTLEETRLCQTLAGHAALSIVETRLSAEQRHYIEQIELKNRELERAEKAAREHERRVADILRYAENVAFVTTDNHPEQPRIVDFSPGAENIFGYSKDEVIGQKVSLLHTPEDAARFPAVIAAMRSQAEGLSKETKLVRKNGEVFSALFQAHPLFDDQDRMSGTLGVSLDISELKQTEHRLAVTLDAYRRSLDGIVQSMGSLMGKRDSYTAEHQVRVAAIAAAIAEELGLDTDTIKGIELAAAIHDIGKIAVPAEILTRPGKLSALEFDMIRTHPDVAYEILANIDFPWPLADIVKQHHEKIDGSGYPAGLSGEDILLEARILCTADVFESMSSHRPYRPALGLEKALEELTANRGVLYDEAAVDACLRLFRSGESASALVE